MDRLNLLPLLRAKLDIDTPYSGAAMTNGFVRPFSESGFIDRAHALSLPPNGREVAQELYLDGLRNIHGLVTQGRTMVGSCGSSTIPSSRPRWNPIVGRRTLSCSASRRC